ECLIECISNIPQTQLSFEQERLRQEEHERFVLTQALILKSSIILGDALKLTAVRETGWYQSVREGGQLLELTDELMAAPVRGTNFLRVAMECRNKTDAQVIVGAVVARWYDIVRRTSAEEFAAEPLRAAREEKQALDQTIRDHRDRLNRVAQRLAPGVRMDPQGNLTQQEVRQYGDQVATLRLELAQLLEYQAIYSDPGGVAVTAEDRALVEQDMEIAQTAQVLLVLDQQRAADVSRFGGHHPIIKRVDAQIKAAQDKLAALRMERLGEIRAEKLELSGTAVDATRQALLVAQERLGRAEAALGDQDRLLLEYTMIEKEVERDQEYLLEIETYIKNLSRVVRQQSAVKVSIAQPATNPLERSSPKLMVLPVGLFLAVALAVGIALAVELLDESVRTSQDIVRHLNIAMLGTVPDTDDEEVKIENVETAVRDAPRSMVAEAFRRIRTNLQFSAPAERQRSLLVTSPRPNDGKTTVACNLALAVAQGGRRVLLVDANFRRPALADVFKKVKGPGLSNLLVGDGSLASCVVKTDTPMLDLLPSGPVPPNPAELLASEQARSFLAEAVSKYDQVIIDTSPVLLASDALGLATVVDGVVLVVRANESSRGVARRACRLFVDVNAHLFGAVLNAAQVTRGGYYREQLRTYYDYQTDVETSAPKPSLPSQTKKSPPSDDELA
ncbi:MAG: polysaccharide biosynthesis tyrosine autokinase, partial [Planctomycetes bacterium]|nr:polysaccharide biosynthesis tyrosine autokinase [Planctomycetota bacterium]